MFEVSDHWDRQVDRLEKELHSMQIINNGLVTRVKALEAEAERLSVHATQIRSQRDELTIENAHLAKLVRELKTALKEIAREQWARTATEAADRFQGIAHDALARTDGDTHGR